MWKINSFIWIYVLVKNYIFPFSKNKDWKELYISISEYNKWGTYGTDQWKLSWHLNNSSLILPSDYDEDSELSKLPNFLKVYRQFFLLYCDLYGCGLSTVYSSATAVGDCLPRISDIVYVLSIWNMMTYSGCENCFLYTICKVLLVLKKLSIYD